MKVVSIIIVLAIALCSCNKPNNSDDYFPNNNSNKKYEYTVYNKSEFPATITIDGVGKGQVSASGKVIIELTGGSHEIKYEQISNYSFAPLISETIVVATSEPGNVISFPSCWTKLILKNGSDYRCTFKVSRSGYGNEVYVVERGMTKELSYIPNGTYSVASEQTQGYTFYPSTSSWSYTPVCDYQQTFTHTTTFNKDAEESVVE
ncbi:MAG: hypothetical protein HUK15_10160 [Bacteroidales bacterium]|nr:hypothetical protein [Bacteroidales bacterium]